MLVGIDLSAGMTTLLKKHTAMLKPEMDLNHA